MQTRLWVYNYDFEFELARQQPVPIGETHRLPWWFLNRSSTLLIPLAGCNDAILTYHPPQDVVLQTIRPLLGKLPRFVVIDVGSAESNSILDDFDRNAAPGNSLATYTLSPWGWSPKAVELAGTYFRNSLPTHFLETIYKVNSKQTSDEIRSKLLPPTFQIPSLQINSKKNSTISLKKEIYGFISKFSKVKIKHYYGASGRLTDTVRDLSISQRKLNQWQAWIEQSGGILLEKALEIDSEYSIQAELDQNGVTHFLTLTRMFSTSNGSYLGNLIDRSDKEAFVNLKHACAPLFSFLAETNYQGPVGLDLLKTSNGCFKLVEINARLTMGRIAYEWNRVLNSATFGFFTNFFMKAPQYGNIASFSDCCLNLEKKYGCSITLINLVHSAQQSISLVTILIGANTKYLIANVLNEIYPSLFQKIRL